jgi:hypothetical protein
MSASFHLQRGIGRLLENLEDIKAEARATNLSGDLHSPWIVRAQWW